MSRIEPYVNSAPPPVRQRRPTREEVRERLIEGAMRAFAEKGFSGASIDYICTQAGFSRGAFYSNFKGKDGLFFALYERRTNKLYSTLEQISQTAGASDRPWDIIAELISAPDGDEVRWDILNKEFIVHALRNPAARERLITSREGSRQRMSEIIVKVEPDLASRPRDLGRICRFIIALHEGQLTQLGLEPELMGETSLLAEFVPMAILNSRVK